MYQRTRTATAWVRPVGFVGFCVWLTACGSQPPNNTKAPPPAQVAAPNEQRYDLRGKVVFVDKAGKKLTVDHEAIPGFMGAMTMSYPVKDEHLLESLSPGERVTAKVVSTGNEFWLENIATDKSAAEGRH
jgi:Cu/Ag efflux protein CusF